MQVIYIDELMLTNFLTDFLLIQAAGKISGAYVKVKNALLSALLGAVYSVSVALMPSSFLESIFLKLTVGLLMTFISFGKAKSYIRISLVFFAVSAAFAGIVMAAALLGGDKYNGIFMPVKMRTLILSFAVSYMIFSTVFSRLLKTKVEGTEAELSICLQGKRVTLTALVDTGNSLKEPITGKPVAICKAGEIAKLFTQEAAAVIRSADDKTQAETIRKLREVCDTAFYLVPYSTISSAGMLIAFRPDYVYKDGKACTAFIAIVPEGKLDNAGYSALIGAEI